MTATSNPFMGKVFVGKLVENGHSKEKYAALLMPDETVEMEFFGIRDGAVFTDRRLLVFNAQGIMGRKHEFSSFPWKSVSAFAVESSGTFDLDAEFKLCGSGFGVCEVQFMKGTDIKPVLQFMNQRIFAAK